MAHAKGITKKISRFNFNDFDAMNCSLCNVLRTLEGSEESDIAKAINRNKSQCSRFEHDNLVNWEYYAKSYLQALGVPEELYLQFDIYTLYYLLRLKNKRYPKSKVWEIIDERRKTSNYQLLDYCNTIKECTNFICSFLGIERYYGLDKSYIMSRCLVPASFRGSQNYLEAYDDLADSLEAREKQFPVLKNLHFLEVLPKVVSKKRTVQQTIRLADKLLKH